MSTEAIIRTLKEAKQENPKHILPRTALKAIADENGDFISSDMTAQDINQLHGKTLVTANAQTLTDEQKAQARSNTNAAAPDGFYGESGGVYQYSTNFLGKNAPTAVKDLVFRPTASAMSGTAWSADSIGGDTATIERIKGKTLVFNQLLDYTNIQSKTENGITFTVNSDHSITLNGTATAQVGLAFPRVDVLSQHKYLYCGIPAGASIDGYRAFLLSANQTSDSISTVDTSDYFTPRIYVGSGTTITNVTFKLRFFDLTQMYGQGREPQTVEEFRAMFPLDYYDYNEGELISFNGTGLQTNGFNQLPSFGSGKWVTGSSEGWRCKVISENPITFPFTYQPTVYRGIPVCVIPCLPNMEYEITPPTGLRVTCSEYADYGDVRDDSKILQSWTNSVESAPISASIRKTTTGESHFMVVSFSGWHIPSALTVNVNTEFCCHFTWSGIRNGEYEPYWNSTLSLPIADYFADGMKSVGAVYDELQKDKAIQCIGSRAYQEGDEDDTTVVTDGTTTYYPLETPVETPISPELNLTYKVDDFGTEKLLPENTATPTTTPMDADIVYQLDYEAQVRNNDQINISKASMDNFIASFNASGLGTITQTYNPNTKQYEYTVTAPQPEPTEGGETT